MNPISTRHPLTRRALVRTSLLACASSILDRSTARAWGGPFRPVAPPVQGAPDPQPAIDSLMHGYMQRYDVPGASLAFMRGGELLYAAGYGSANKAKHLDVTADSRFRIASNSKAFTAAGIFLLAEANRLELTSKVFGKSGLLPEYPTGGPHRDWQESMTVHDLLTHTAGGWANQRDDPMFQMPDLNQKELIAWTLRTYPLEVPPGTRYAYSNFGYCVLGRVIEKLSGKTYTEFTTDRVIRPSGIADMQIATDHTAAGEVQYYAVPGDGDPYSIPITRMDSHGGWIATATDQARFLSALFAPQDAPASRGLLSPQSLKSMTTATEANPRYACGLAVNPAGNAWHTGSLPGTTSLMVHTHSGMSWAAVLNTRNRDTDMELALDKLMWSMARTVPAWQA